MILIALGCIERDLLAPLSLTKPQFEAFQRHWFRHRKADDKPLAWSSQHLHLKEVCQFFAWLAKHNDIPFNLAAELELPPVFGETLKQCVKVALMPVDRKHRTWLPFDPVVVTVSQSSSPNGL